jgi:hypothetical protein
MAPEKYQSRDVEALLAKGNVCTFEEIKHALGTESRATVFRKLSELAYQTSYSHSGMYYALRSTCRFNDDGLWSCRKAWFSVYGTLIDTSMKFVDQSSKGFTNSELDQALHVETRLSLGVLLKRGLISREKVGGVFVYVSSDEPVRRRQIVSRHDALETSSIDDHILAHELKAAIVLFGSLLDEQQIRIFAGLESLRIGKGGDAVVGRILKIDPHTVARGRAELLARDLEIERIRRQGGGRKSVKKKSRK